MEAVLPDSARAVLLSEHARLRARIERLIADGVPAGRRFGHAALCGRLAELQAAVEEHVGLEERELVPILQGADAWGPVRVARARERHAAILRAIDELASELACAERGPWELFGRLENLVSPLLVDLAEEETAMSAIDEAGGPVGEQESG